MLKSIIFTLQCVFGGGMWCYDTARPGDCSNNFNHECRSWCSDKQACFEMDRRFSNGTHHYIRGCWEQGSSDALKRTGCMTLAAETDISDEDLELGMDTELTRESLCIQTCTTSDCNHHLEFANEVFSSSYQAVFATFFVGLLLI